MSFCILLYYFMKIIFRKKMYIKFLKTKFYKNRNIKDNIRIEITETSITEYYNDLNKKLYQNG
jgi:hypothetical protein